MVPVDQDRLNKIGQNVQKEKDEKKNQLEGKGLKLQSMSTQQESFSESTNFGNIRSISQIPNADDEIELEDEHGPKASHGAGKY